tara:strand:- start:246 stop:1073 length:828 start_codon:yes stop_codon:yes gene_type:complete
MNVNGIPIYGLGAGLDSRLVYTGAIIIYVWFGVIIREHSNSTLMHEHKDLLPDAVRESLASLSATMHRLRKKTDTDRLKANKAARCSRLYEKISAIAEHLHKHTNAHQPLLPALLLDFIAFTKKERQCSQILEPSTSVSIASAPSTLAPLNEVVTDASVTALAGVAFDSTKTLLAEFGDNIEPIWWRQAGRLSQGSWFEMSATEPPLRCRLAAILTSIDQYIFVNRLGVKVVEKNQLQLARALKSNELRVIDDGVSFERALEGVVSDLRQSRGLA